MTIEALDPFLRNYAELLKLSAETLVLHGYSVLAREILEDTAKKAIQ